MTLVEAQELLSSFDGKLRSYTENIISSRRSMKIVKASVTEVTANHVTLDDTSCLPCGMVIWSTGLAPRCVLKLSFWRGGCVVCKAWEKEERKRKR